MLRDSRKSKMKIACRVRLRSFAHLPSRILLLNTFRVPGMVPLPRNFPCSSNQIDENGPTIAEPACGPSAAWMNLKPVELEVFEKTAPILNFILFGLFPKKLNSSFRAESDTKNHHNQHHYQNLLLLHVSFRV